jgi:hypothetical protein
MNKKFREYMWRQNQFVFTLPACGFVVALDLGLCPDDNGVNVNEEALRRQASEINVTANEEIPNCGDSGRRNW